MKFFVAYFILFAPFFARTRALKCLVCDSIYQSADSDCQLRDCDEYAKEWLEFEDKLASEDEKLTNRDQLSLKAYYHNMTKLENLPKKESSTGNTNDGSKFFDICVSKLGVHDGRLVKMKACGRQKWDFCKNDKDKEIFVSCSTCETDNCNTLQCYSCSDRVVADISHITPCKETPQNLCHGDFIKCFSATSVKNGQNIEYRGCIYKNETKISTQFFEKESLSYYFCEKNLCNVESTKSEKRDGQKCGNDSCKNTHRYKKSETNGDDAKNKIAEANKDFACYICEGVAPDGYCPIGYCYKKINSTKKFNCLSASGKINGEQRVYKACTDEGSNKCEELKKKGYDSCSTCENKLCNGLKCHVCDDYDTMKDKYIKVQSCNSLGEQLCGYNDLSECFSARTSLNGKDVRLKGCIKKIHNQNFTKYLDSYGFKYYFCDENFCNKNDDNIHKKFVMFF